jgi:hypothetical protein
VTEPTNAGPDEPISPDESTSPDEPISPDKPTTTEPIDGTPAAVPTGAQEPPAVDPVERFRNRHAVQSGKGSGPRWLAAVALVVALVALGVTAWVQYRSNWSAVRSTAATTTTSAAPPAPSPQQVADAKMKACGAYDLVSRAVNGRANVDVGPDPATALAQAVQANARLALAAGQPYLLDRLDPATPPPLADTIRKYANNIEDVAMASLAGMGTDDPAQADRVKEWGPLNDQITDMCK